MYEDIWSIFPEKHVVELFWLVADEARGIPDADDAEHKQKNFKCDQITLQSLCLY